MTVYSGRLRPWDDTFITVHGEFHGSPSPDPIMPWMLPAAEAQWSPVWTPLGTGPIVRWYWLYVMAFFVALFASMPGTSALFVGAGVAALIGVTVVFGGAIERALRPVWPYLKWLIVFGLVAAAFYPFVKDIHDGKLPVFLGLAE